MTTSIQNLTNGSRVYTTITVGRGTAVHSALGTVIERNNRKSLAVYGHAICAQPNAQSGATKVSEPVTCKRCEKLIAAYPEWAPTA